METAPALVILSLRWLLIFCCWCINGTCNWESQEIYVRLPQQILGICTPTNCEEFISIRVQSEDYPYLWEKKYRKWRSESQYNIDIHNIWLQKSWKTDKSKQWHDANTTNEYSNCGQHSWINEYINRTRDAVIGQPVLAWEQWWAELIWQGAGHKKASLQTEY